MTPFIGPLSPGPKLSFFLSKKKYPCGKNSVIDNLVKQAMSSPGTSKTSRPMTPLPKDYHTAVSEMDTNNLLRSTLTDDCRTQKGDQRTCLICGLSYFWRPSRCRTHLGLAGSTKQVQLCKPYPEHKEFWATTKVCVKVLLPAVKVLRFSDGMRGGNLGLMYNLLLQLDELYSSHIDGLPEKVRTKVSPRCIV